MSVCVCVCVHVCMRVCEWVREGVISHMTTNLNSLYSFQSTDENWKPSFVREAATIIFKVLPPIMTNTDTSPILYVIE